MGERRWLHTPKTDSKSLALTRRGFCFARPEEPNVQGYELRPPHPQNALDIFSGEWTSVLPGSEGTGLSAGLTHLSDDKRVKWALGELGGVSGKRVLELGPLEGAHSWLLERAGAAEVIAIEANRRAYLRCLIVKELSRLDRTRFLCGDFGSYLRTAEDSFDVAFACGVLYHQTDPMQLLHDLGRIAPAIFLWTHYYDAERMAANRKLDGKVGPLVDDSFQGRPYRWAEFRYLQALDWAGFSGGTQPSAHWLPREDILSSLASSGFGKIRIAYEEPDHVNGPAFAVVATK